MYLQKLKKMPTRNWVALGITSLFLLLPAWVIHAQLANPGVLFTANSNGDWEYTSGMHDGQVYSSSITPDGRGNDDAGTGTVDTNIPTNIRMEAFMTDTGRIEYSNVCPTPVFTGNPTVDFACEINVSQSQEYPYAIGQSWQDADTQDQIATTTCNCP